TERARHIVGRVRLQLARGAIQLGALVVGFRWIELEADRGHGEPGIWNGGDYISPSRWMCNCFICAAARCAAGREPRQSDDAGAEGRPQGLLVTACDRASGGDNGA